jgi:apolipoprotein N-acyltransferase
MIWAILSGILMALALPPLNLDVMPWISLIPLFYVLQNRIEPKRAFGLGLLFGIVYLAVLFWGLNGLNEYAPYWATVGFVAVVFYYAFFYGLFFLLINQLKRGSYFFLALASGWVLMEFIRSLGPFGSTLGGLGYLEGNLIALQSAGLGGVYFLSFLIVLFNAVSAQYLAKKLDQRVLAVVAALLLVLSGYGIYKLSHPAIINDSNRFRVLIVQPNIAQSDKLDFNQGQEILRVHEILTLQNRAASLDAIIWPETAVTGYLLGRENYLEEIKTFIGLFNANFLTGAPYWDGKEAFNSAFSFNRNGTIVGRFDKEVLVPFGEYLLFRPLFYPLLNGEGLFSQDFSIGRNKPEPLKLGKAQAATAICFESVYPNLVRRRVNFGSDFILVITNDAWFGASSIPEHHVRISRLRAIENNRYLVQCANTGISAIIDPSGRIVKHTQLLSAEVIKGQIALTKERSVYSMLGDWIVWLSMAVIAWLVFF